MKQQAKRVGRLQARASVLERGDYMLSMFAQHNSTCWTPVREAL